MSDKDKQLARVAVVLGIVLVILQIVSTIPRYNPKTSRLASGERKLPFNLN